jgi:hypothetical protein
VTSREAHLPSRQGAVADSDTHVRTPSGDGIAPAWSRVSGMPNERGLFRVRRKQAYASAQEIISLDANARHPLRRWSSSGSSEIAPSVASICGGSYAI